MDELKDRGLVLLGCGRMGSAMLRGWLAKGLPAGSVWVVDPHPSDWLRGLEGLNLNAELPASPAMVVVAVKPQMMGEALPNISALGDGRTVFLSVAAGTSIARLQETVGACSPVIRAMPNTPAAVGRGITALVANEAGAPHLALAETLMAAVGQTVRLADEAQMDAVTALSGSGPAYVFLMIEAMAAAGEAEGLSSELALSLARATVAGAGSLAELADEAPGELRRNVTSPNGTTQAALDVLMADDGLAALMRRAVAAAANRSRELGK